MKQKKFQIKHSYSDLLRFQRKIALLASKILLKEASNSTNTGAKWLHSYAFFALDLLYFSKAISALPVLIFNKILILQQDKIFISNRALSQAIKKCYTGVGVGFKNYISAFWWVCMNVHAALCKMHLRNFTIQRQYNSASIKYLYLSTFDLEIEFYDKRDFMENFTGVCLEALSYQGIRIKRWKL